MGAERGCPALCKSRADFKLDTVEAESMSKQRNMSRPWGVTGHEQMNIGKKSQDTGPWAPQVLLRSLSWEPPIRQGPGGGTLTAGLKGSWLG